ncbi:MAG: hypothetical protein RB191_18435 [Terriglobia bacterium]|nr:hypothetical protein [Terriglobia bacterium]
MTKPPICNRTSSYIAVQLSCEFCAARKLFPLVGALQTADVRDDASDQSGDSADSDLGQFGYNLEPDR